MQSGVEQIGKELFAYMKAQSSGFNIFKLQNLKDLLLKLSISQPELKQKLFHFVDVLPVLKTKEQKSQFFVEYLVPYLPKFLHQHKCFSSCLDFAIGLGVSIMAQSFICGSNLAEAKLSIKRLERDGLDYTIDILGELALTQAEADQYFNEYIELIEGLEQANISVKLSALIPQVNQLDYEAKKARLKYLLREIYRKAIERQCFINVDTEHYDWKEMTYQLIQELLMEDEFRNWQGAGIVLQAYLKESKTDFKEWLAWVQRRGTSITVRLVKGAYWDSEYAIAKQNGFDLPVWERKHESDINFEELCKELLDNHSYLRPAIASHNIRSLAYALNYAKSKQIAATKFELQMLYGMLDPIKDYLVEQGYQTRVYMPYGELVPGMSYLVRRLLENTANDSFLRQGFLEGTQIEELLGDPRNIKAEKAETFASFSNSSNIDFSQKVNREQMEEALDKYKPVEIYDHSLDDCDRAIATAIELAPLWNKAKPELRATVLQDCALSLEEHRFKFNALICKKVNKPWQEADREVSETIDFLNYYAQSSLDLYSKIDLLSLPGERNTNHYQAYGPSLVISPWNFPLALMAGMTSAALVMGNPVIIKASQLSKRVAHEFVKLLQASIDKHAVNYSEGLLQLIQGDGRSLGNYLAEHEAIRLIAFTGSNKVGMKLNDIARKARPVKAIEAEMGGKNAIIVDQSADPDEAIPGVLYSAFAFAGQKCSACSRLIVEEAIYDKFKQRLVEAAASINIGDPCDQATSLGPVVDDKAYKEINRYIKLAERDGKSLLEPQALEPNYISPRIFEGLDSDHKVVQEEIFGPVLVLLKANDIDHALELANDSDYGLTGGLYSRSPKNIAKVKRHFQVGNLYINRPCTGAVVARQAFGGTKQSSIGFKAGGPNYLLQFVQEKTISENTMRRGFVADS